MDRIVMNGFDEKSGQYCYEHNGLIFAWEEAPKEDFIDTVKTLSENYHAHIDEIAQFMRQDLAEMYGETSIEEIKSKLGKPIIDCDRGCVSYCEQTFDDIHIFEFEFSDNQFQELHYFSVNG